MTRPNSSRRAGTDKRDLLERFSGNEELLIGNGVTDEELEVLKTVSLFGDLTSARDIAFILSNIRGTKRPH